MSKINFTSTWRLWFLGLTTVAIGILPFLPVPEAQTGGLTVFLGRFHPLLLHFPIVLVLLILGIEGWKLLSRKGDGDPRNTTFLINALLGLALVSVLVTVIGGYLLYRSGDYQGELVRQHLWGGVLLMLALNAAAFFRWVAPLKQAGANSLLYRGLLLTAGIVTLYTSHLGGTITHGQDFLTEHMPSLQPLEPAPVEKKKPEELLVFGDLIMPMLDDHCLSCHNQYKTKGGLLLTSYTDIQKGGKSEKALLVANDPQKSELYHRITLPSDDDERMPPPEKAPLTKDEISLIHWWIQEGASEDMMLGTPPDSIAMLLERYLPQLFQSERLKMRQENEMAELAEELEELGDDLGLVIQPDPENPGYFGVSMQMPPVYVDNKTVSGLMPYASLYSKLSLPGAEITDEALYDISKMTHLKELYLPKTCIKGEGLVYLQALEELESINLSNSFLSNEGILHLIQLPQLKTAYVFGVETDTTVLQAMRKHLPEVDILEEEGPYY